MNILYFLNENSGAIQGIATVTLVLITLYYAVQTKKTVKQMKEARLDEFLPILEIRADSKNDSNKLSVYISNVGKGLARSPKLFVPFSKSAELSDMGSRGYTSYEIDVSQEKLMSLENSNRKIRIEYLDVFSRLISSEAIIIRLEKEEDNSIRPDNTTGYYLSSDDWKLILPN
jgi:hypothetical protein